MILNIRILPLLAKYRRFPPRSYHRQSFCATSGPTPDTTPSNLPLPSVGSCSASSSISEVWNLQLKLRRLAGRSLPTPADHSLRQIAGSWWSFRTGWHKLGTGPFPPLKTFGRFRPESSICFVEFVYVCRGRH
uniref:(northern house mosquito) hypothetical protein n=1 Tax=Culex pipiens TaxID=7175 RepID=A0A8D8A7D0_CULPI